LTGAQAVLYFLGLFLELFLELLLGLRLRFAALGREKYAAQPGFRVRGKK
jgi:hypothetical protein